MAENQLESLESSQLPEQKPPLNWVDICLTVGGIVIFYALLIIGTIWLAGKIHNEKVLIYINGFLTQLSFIVLIFIFKKIRKRSWKDLGWRSVSFRGIWLQILRLYLLTLFINLLYAIYLEQKGFSPPTRDVYTMLFHNATWLTYLLNIFLAVLIAPVVEETLFRGIIFSSVRTYFGKWSAATVSAALFSALHLQAYGFFPRFVLGLILAHLYEQKHSLYPAMTFHAVNNLIAMSLLSGISALS